MMINYCNVAGISLGVGIALSNWNYWLGFITMVNMMLFGGVYYISKIGDNKNEKKKR